MAEVEEAAKANLTALLEDEILNDPDAFASLQEQVLQRRGGLVS